jgi:hypothetical protein
VWSLALAGSFGGAADAECCDAGMGVLRRLFDLARGRGAAAAPDAAAALILAGLRPQVPVLLASLCSAIAHAAPSSTVEPASQLLLAVSLTFAPEWHALLPAAVERLGDELRDRGRVLPPRAAQLLLRAALQPSPLSTFDFVAMWNDMAQVTRMGVSARALERYQPR